jgi:hypothetical protein
MLPASNESVITRRYLQVPVWLLESQSWRLHKP